MITPTVHMNGTSRDDLANGYKAVWRHLHRAKKALQEAAPHPRDYYPQDREHPTGNAYGHARLEYMKRMDAIRWLMDETEQIIRSLYPAGAPDGGPPEGWNEGNGPMGEW